MNHVYKYNPRIVNVLSEKEVHSSVMNQYGQSHPNLSNESVGLSYPFECNESGVSSYPCWVSVSFTNSSPIEGNESVLFNYTA